MNTVQSITMSPAGGTSGVLGYYIYPGGEKVTPGGYWHEGRGCRKMDECSSVDAAIFPLRGVSLCHSRESGNPEKPM